MDWFSKLFEIDKLPFKVVLLISIISGIIVFAPELWLANLQLLEFKKEYARFVGVSFLFSFGLMLSNSILLIYNSFMDRALKIKGKKLIRERLLQLDDSERAILREFYMQGKYTLELPINNPSVIGLKRKGVLQIASNYFEHSYSGLFVSCVIVEEARKQLTYEMLDFREEKPSQTELKRLEDLRPAFIRDIQRREGLRSLYF